ncbi:HGxxPAAW family protein [Streptomyces fagopyri]|uniref:HGxxPAAW family protein n=1 Tax=Streptomyces fagopyri TaxID=2662397 RepID=UPI0033C14103
MHGDHVLGHTVAGWAGTTIAVTGCTVTAVALAAGSPTGLWLGGAVVVLAALATWLLHLAGWGKAGGPRPVARQHWRVRDASARRGHPDCLGCRMAGRRVTAASDVAAAAASDVAPAAPPDVAPAAPPVPDGRTAAGQPSLP